MAKMGRPKSENPCNHVVTVKFREDEYEMLVEYTKRHNLSVSAMIRLGIQMQLEQEKSQEK